MVKCTISGLLVKQINLDNLDGADSVSEKALRAELRLPAEEASPPVDTASACA